MWRNSVGCCAGEVKAGDPTPAAYFLTAYSISNSIVKHVFAAMFALFHVLSGSQCYEMSLTVVWKRLHRLVLESFGYFKRCFVKLAF